MWRLSPNPAHIWESAQNWRGAQDRTLWTCARSGCTLLVVAIASIGVGLPRGNGQARQRRRKLLVLGGVLALTAASVLIFSTVVGDKGSIGTLTIGGAGVPAPAQPQSYSDRQIAQIFLRDGGFIDHVTRVAVKRTTWAAFLPYSGRTHPPSDMAMTDVIDVVIQAGTVHPAAFGQGATGPDPNGYQYAWVAHVVYPNNLIDGPAIIWDQPGSSWPTWFANVPGTETDAHS